MGIRDCAMAHLYPEKFVAKSYDGNIAEIYKYSLKHQYYVRLSD
jgi:hypothetical protein